MFYPCKRRPVISTPAILDLNGDKIVPVRAIPFVTGNLTALTVAKLLADPELNWFAYVLGSGIAPSVMFPKEWEPIFSELRSLENAGPRSSRRDQIAALPSSTFVYWEGLWRTYENLYTGDRGDREGYSPGELANFQLQKNVNLPKDLVELVFEGFNLPSTNPSLIQQASAIATNPCVSSTNASGVISKPDNGWKSKIQIEAASHMKTLRKSGASPTVHSILDRMVDWCRNNDVKTNGGIYPSSGYLRTHVLGGKHWTPPT